MINSSPSRIFVRNALPDAADDEGKKHRKEVCTNINKMIDDDYHAGVKRGLAERSCWKTTGDVTETFGHIFIGCSAIIAFAAGFFNIAYLSFIAGSLSTGAILLLKFSSYSMKESKERTDETNRILNKLNIDELVDIAIDSAGTDDNGIGVPKKQKAPPVIVDLSKA